jgi:hypothetical protein
MTGSERRDRDRATVSLMKGKSTKAKTVKPKKPLVVDEEMFTSVISSLANANPMPLEKLRRKNPETDPRYLPVFDLSRKIRIEKPKKK